MFSSAGKIFINKKEDTITDDHLRPQTIEEYNKDIEEAEAEIEKGAFYTHEEGMEMSKTW